MQIPLNSFENYIDETILKRGLQYFKKGQVSEIEEVGANEYQAIVSGTDDYTVQLTVKNDTVTEFVCDCPYDGGPVCKHVAAVIFALQQEELGMQNGTLPKLPKTKKTAKTPKKKTPAEEVKELLDKVPHEELKEFVREKTARDTMLRSQLISYFSAYNTDFSHEYYENQLKAIKKAAMGRDGFIEWRKTKEFNKNVSEYLQLAENSLAENNFAKAMNIAMAVAVQSMDAFNCGDDSNGEFGSLISGAFELLQQLAEKPLSESEKTAFIAFCYNAFDKEIFEGWDWHTDLLQFALSQIKTENETNEIVTRLDKYEKADDKYGWHKEKSQRLKYQIFAKFDKNKAENFLYQNLENEKFRTVAIEKAIAAKDYEKAKKIAFDGIEFDKKDKPGIVRNWYEFLLQIAQVENDTAKMIEYAKWLFIDDFHTKQDYYQFLKNTVKQAEWAHFVENLITELKSSKRGSNGRIADIYIKEGQTDKLFELVKSQMNSEKRYFYGTHNLETVAAYEKTLSQQYSKELIGLYANEIQIYLENATGRDAYKNACKYLRRIIKLGGRETANELIKNLRETYSKRPALLQELDRV